MFPFFGDNFSFLLCWLIEYSFVARDWHENLLFGNMHWAAAARRSEFALHSRIHTHLEAQHVNRMCLQVEANLRCNFISHSVSSCDFYGIERGENRTWIGINHKQRQTFRAEQTIVDKRSSSSSILPFSCRPHAWKLCNNAERAVCQHRKRFDRAGGGRIANERAELVSHIPIGNLPTDTETKQMPSNRQT